ncbi:hypothetical protein KGF54_003118 [Candida jiufengensis]|uniref:uncharacterized protein n=1 Tax=Candida jiufengensis TaxID=497108 RepID=UPI002225276E|nr:uncharacterized protein KGF54_003118 [Candida jiufengensis]KAI5952252.1 hypothetical protein KGF54_003118 [Candida jiufengensis]
MSTNSNSESITNQDTQVDPSIHKFENDVLLNENVSKLALTKVNGPYQIHFEYWKQFLMIMKEDPSYNVNNKLIKHLEFVEHNAGTTTLTTDKSMLKFSLFTFEKVLQLAYGNNNFSSGEILNGVNLNDSGNEFEESTKVDEKSTKEDEFNMKFMEFEKKVSEKGSLALNKIQAAFASYFENLPEGDRTIFSEYISLGFEEVMEKVKEVYKNNLIQRGASA